MSDRRDGIIDWKEGKWTNVPAEVRRDGSDLLVLAEEGSDAWRHTSYGFVHDTEHALLAPFQNGSAMEVEYDAAFTSQFDQAGIFLRVSGEHWIKAGVEFSDGQPQLGAVVTNGQSDWSLASVPEWLNTRVCVRASREGNAVTVRAWREGTAPRLVRVIPLAPDLQVTGGPFVCAPTRAGLTVRFTAWRILAPDGALHD